MADEDLSPEDARLEKENFLRVLRAFKIYRKHSLRRVDNAEHSYSLIPDAHKKMIPYFLNHLRKMRNCIEQNYEIIKLIIKDCDTMFENRQDGLITTFQEDQDENISPSPRTFDLDKVRTTLKQFVRDWSEQGQGERDACYQPVISAIQQYFPPDKYEPSTVSILVPGAGLGRLAFEIANLGYSCQGNEWSLYMLFASNFVLNKCQEVNCYVLYPWVHQWTNNKTSDDQTEAIRFPDVNPGQIPVNSQFSMAAGDFLEVYKEEDSWDCVATVFFIDTAHNIIEYIERIYKILKPGGIWINLGPLLYHYADMPQEVSIELSYEDVRRVVKDIGFVIETEKHDLRSQYTQNTKSMLQYTYNSVFFAAKKPVS